MLQVPDESETESEAERITVEPAVTSCCLSESGVTVAAAKRKNFNTKTSSPVSEIQKSTKGSAPS